MTACLGCHRQPPPTPASPVPRGSCPDHPKFAAGCPPCRKAGNNRTRTRVRDRAYGRPDPVVNPADAHDHVTHLRDQHGMSQRQIADAARVGHCTINRIAAGNSPYIWATTAAAILAVRPAAGPRPHDSVDSTGTARRLQALAAVGWGAGRLAPMLGIADRYVQSYRRRERPAILAKTAAAVAELYARLEGTAGPDTQARRSALARGWVPPLAWDDGTIDDPDAQPWGGQGADTAPVVDEVAIRRALSGERIKLTRLERHHAVHHGVPRYGVNAVAAALRMSGSTVGDLYRRPLPASTEEVAA